MGEKKVHKLEKIFPNFVQQKKIEYKDKKIIIYLTENNKAYFDLHP